MSDFLDHLINRALVHEPVIQPRSLSYFELPHSEEGSASSSETEWPAQYDRADHANKDDAAATSRLLTLSQLRGSSSFVKAQEQTVFTMDHEGEAKPTLSSPESPSQPSGPGTNKPDTLNIVDTVSSEDEPVNVVNPYIGTTEKSTSRSTAVKEFISDFESSGPTTNIKTERKSNVAPDGQIFSKQEEKSAPIKPNRIISASADSNQIQEDRVESLGAGPSTEESLDPTSDIDRTENTSIKSGTKASKNPLSSFTQPINTEAKQDVKSKIERQNIPITPAVNQEAQVQETAETRASILFSRKESVRPSTTSVEGTINTPLVSAPGQSNRIRSHSEVSTPEKFDAMSNIAVKIDNRQTDATDTVNTSPLPTEKVAIKKSEPGTDSASHSLLHRGLLVQPISTGEIRPMQHRRNEPAARQEPTIHVSIGRIEVKAIPPQSAAPQRKLQTKPSTMSLDDYLLKRDGGAK